MYPIQTSGQFIIGQLCDCKINRILKATQAELTHWKEITRGSVPASATACAKAVVVVVVASTVILGAAAAAIVTRALAAAAAQHPIWKGHKRDAI